MIIVIYFSVKTLMKSKYISSSYISSSLKACYFGILSNTEIISLGKIAIALKQKENLKCSEARNYLLKPVASETRLKNACMSNHTS